MSIKSKDLFAAYLLLLIPSLAKSQTEVQTKTFTAPSVIQAGASDNFFSETKGDEDADIDAAADWDHMISGSFGFPEEAQDSKKAKEAERVLDVLPPNDVNNRLIDESSLPLLAAFGNPLKTPDQWPRGKTWLTGQLPVSRYYDLKGCKFNLKTGPISVAHYFKVKDEFELRSDSVLPMTLIEPEAKGFSLFLSANADLYPELDQKTIDICSASLKGKIVPIGKFDLGQSAITLGKTNLKHKVQIASKSTVKNVQVYLYWPVGRSDPLLIDDSGLYPVLSTPIYEIKSQQIGASFLEVIPHLTYVRGGKALTKKRLLELWGQ